MAHAYLDESLGPVRAGELVEITGDEAHHAVKAARLAVGERIRLGDGRGMRVECEAAEVAPGRFVARALEDSVVEPEPSPRLHLAQALAKGGRDEQAVQAAVELGVDGVVPWQARRSIAQWRGEKAEKQRARWQAIVREATKQSLRARLPGVAALHDARTLAEAVPGAKLLVLDPGGEVPLRDAPLDADDLVLVVGPEGGIDPAELEGLERAGAVRVRLGASVLRTSTAGPAALAALQLRLGRW